MGPWHLLTVCKVRLRLFTIQAYKSSVELDYLSLQYVLQIYLSTNTSISGFKPREILL